MGVRPAGPGPSRRRRPQTILPRVVSRKTAAAIAKQKAAFLTAFTTRGNIAAAGRVAKVGRRTHYDWLETDAAYVRAFKDAQDEAADWLDTEARRRAVQGVVTGETVQVRQVGKDGKYRRLTLPIRKYSDGLLMFLLKGARPEVYAERHIHKGTGKRGAILLEDIIAGAAEDAAAAGAS